MEFKVISREKSISSPKPNTIYLRVDNWNDFSFVTMFFMSFCDEDGDLNEIGNVRIGFKGQTTSESTYEKLDKSFSDLSLEFFSLGVEESFYENLSSYSDTDQQSILEPLNDIVFNIDIISDIREEKVFSTSLLRDISLSEIKVGLQRILNGLPPLTDFDFSFVRDSTHSAAPIRLDFNVERSSTPSTNIHSIIGRNGVGKTTLLNGMIKSIIDADNSPNSRFLDCSRRKEKPIESDFFSSLVSVSFSAFDPFSPPLEQPDPAKGTCYFYIGLKSFKGGGINRTLEDLQEDCAYALMECFRKKEKKDRWLKAINKLGSDENFHSMNLKVLLKKYRSLRREVSSDIRANIHAYRKLYLQKIADYLTSMSSGHAIVLLTITRLVATVEEKTLILIDEPESHLHPPLLSAFIRSLSELTYDKNAVAIIATHSPVVLQEVPRSCVWKVNRIGGAMERWRPKTETFGENVGVLTKEVFGLEVSSSGFHDLLAKSVAIGGGYDDIVKEYNEQLGMEARALLKALILERERSKA